MNETTSAVPVQAGKHMTDRPLPDWPAAMEAETAAAYVSLSVASLRRHGPKPIALTPGRSAWLRSDLDDWLAVRAGRAVASSLDILAHG